MKYKVIHIDRKEEIPVGIYKDHDLAINIAKGINQKEGKTVKIERYDNTCRLLKTEYIDD